jgi:NADH dehydrogenase
MILVVGSTGFLGGEICRRLRASGDAVRGLTRTTSDPAAVDRLRAMGVEIAIGDLRDRESLDAACRDIDTVCSTATITRSRQPGDSIEATDEAGQLRLIDAARAAGVRRFVYISYSQNLKDDGPLTRAKRAVEQRLRESGMAYTILRPSYFMEVWLSPHLGFDYMNRKATLYGGGDATISFISLGDVAEFAVRVLHSPDVVNATLELGGPDAVSPHDAVHIFEEVADASFVVLNVPEEAVRALFEGATDSLQKSFSGLMLDYARGDEIPMRETLERIPVKLTSVREYARSVLGA